MGVQRVEKGHEEAGGAAGRGKVGRREENKATNSLRDRGVMFTSPDNELRISVHLFLHVGIRRR